MISKVMYSSRTDNWSTPQDLYDILNREFHFTLDPCADDFNHKCDLYFTAADDGLSRSWAGHSVFCNPPYSRSIKEWVKKAYYENLISNTNVVMLLPARTDTSWFHDYINCYAEVRFIRGRIRFGNARNNAPFPSMIVIFRAIEVGEPNA